jgi:ubiquitin carboxyl-terminal hydrolase L3
MVFIFNIGRNPYPINHGKCTSLLEDSVLVIKKYMELAPENLNFTVMALATMQ